MSQSSLIHRDWIYKIVSATVQPDSTNPSSIAATDASALPSASNSSATVLGCTALVAGTTVGAGILALPAVTLPAGVIPSSVALVLVWLYAVAAGLLIAEASICRMQQGQAGVGLIALTEAALGPVGVRLAGGAYLFLHYALLVAYVAQGGEILGGMIHALPVLNALPIATGAVLFVAVFGGVLYAGTPRLVERLNTVFVVGLLVVFVGLLGMGAIATTPTRLTLQNWGALTPAISVMAVALFFHNVVPVITTQLQGDIPKIRRSIIVGSAIPLLMFLAWNVVILTNETLAEAASLTPFDPLQLLRGGVSGKGLGVLVSVFSELAIATSFIGFVYGLLDLFKDLWKVTPTDPTHRLTMFSWILLPCLAIALINPNIFLPALDYAGTFSISCLSGILPVVIVWQQRYRTNPMAQRLVPGGRAVLVLMGSGAIALLFHRLIESV